MSKFRKKPVVVEATQWLQHGDHPAVTAYIVGVEIPVAKLCAICGNGLSTHGSVETLEGCMKVCPSDWIITGVKGEVYPCKDDIFKQTYESAGE